MACLELRSMCTDLVVSRRANGAPARRRCGVRRGLACLDVRKYRAETAFPGGPTHLQDVGQRRHGALVRGQHGLYVLEKARGRVQ